VTRGFRVDHAGHFNGIARFSSMRGWRAISEWRCPTRGEGCQLPGADSGQRASTGSALIELVRENAMNEDAEHVREVWQILFRLPHRTAAAGPGNDAIGAR
jgi:hypothetical protein